MKKLILFFGVIFCCTLFSCKKDASNYVPIETLPIPLTNGTWWKYQRIDTTIIGSYYGNMIRADSCIELITVIGKAPYSNAYYNIIAPESVLLQVKNITKGTLDTIHAFYDSSSFYIVPNKDTFFLYSNVNLIEGATQNVYSQYPKAGWGNVRKNVSITVMNKLFENTVYNYDTYNYIAGNRGVSHGLITYLKPGVGYVDWYYSDFYFYYYDKITRMYHRRLMDYHIAP